MRSNLPNSHSFLEDKDVCAAGKPLHSFCKTVAARKSKATGNPTLLVSFTNFGYLDMAHNFIEALHRLGIYNVVMFALDLASYERLKALNIYTWLLCSKQNTVYTEESSSFGSPEFNSICNVKPWIVSECLKGGFDVVWTDTDVVWLRDAQPFFELFPTVDMQLQGDDDDICAGFFFARSTAANIKLLDSVLSYVNTCMDDQTALRRFLHEEEGLAHRLTRKPDDLSMTRHLDWLSSPPHIELKPGVANYLVLPRSLFPNGTAYFNVKLPQRFGIVPYIVHNNCIIGHDSKVDRFKMYNMWYIAEPNDVDFDKSDDKKICKISPSLTLTPHREVVTCVSFGPDARILYTSAYDKTVKTYYVDSILAAISDDDAVREGPCPTLKPSGGGLLNRRGGVWAMAWLPGEQTVTQTPVLPLPSILSASSLGGAYLIPGLSNIRKRLSISDEETSLEEVDAPESSQSSNSMTEMSSTASGKLHQGHPKPICVTGGHDRHLMIWNCDEDGLAKDVFANQGPWTLRQTMKGHQGVVNAVVYHRETIFSASDDSTVRSWDPKKGEKIRVYRAGASNNAWMTSIACDGPALFASSSDGCAYAWEIATGRIMQAYVGHSGWVRSIAVHGASKRVYTAGSDGKIKEWDMIFGYCLRTLHNAHYNADGATGINKISLWCDEDDPRALLRIDSAGDDGKIRTWDVATWQCLEEFSGASGPITTFARHRNLIVAGGADHFVRVWESKL